MTTGGRRIEVPTVSSDADINYILSILDISDEYKSRKDIQKKITS